MTLYGGPAVAGPDGLTYGVLVAALPADDLGAWLAEARFTGLVGPQDGRWSVAVADDPLGHVASQRRRLLDVAADLAATQEAAAAGVVVVRDRLLRLWAGVSEHQVIEYVSDPSAADPNDDEATDTPLGAEDAPALAAWAGVPDVAPDVAALLGGVLGESENESERLHELSRLLGWPEWLVSVDSLPRRISGGPDPSTFVRLKAGRTGVSGWAAGSATRVVRRKT
ncbi:MAG: hypothetical protein FWD18_08425 [Micrococcales bacterium]|nr:hypothetical protein [Micrococcales bacterium]